MEEGRWVNIKKAVRGNLDCPCLKFFYELGVEIKPSTKLIFRRLELYRILDQVNIIPIMNVMFHNIRRVHINPNGYVTIAYGKRVEIFYEHSFEKSVHDTVRSYSKKWRQ